MKKSIKQTPESAVLEDCGKYCRACGSEIIVLGKKFYQFSPSTAAREYIYIVGCSKIPWWDFLHLKHDHHQFLVWRGITGLHCTMIYGGI